MAKNVNSRKQYMFFQNKCQQAIDESRGLTVFVLCKYVLRRLWHIFRNLVLQFYRTKNDYGRCETPPGQGSAL